MKQRPETKTRKNERDIPDTKGLISQMYIKITEMKSMSVEIKTAIPKLTQHGKYYDPTELDKFVYYLTQYHLNHASLYDDVCEVNNNIDHYDDDVIVKLQHDLDEIKSIADELYKTKKESLQLTQIKTKTNLLLFDDPKFS